MVLEFNMPRNAIAAFSEKCVEKRVHGVVATLHVLIS